MDEMRICHVCEENETDWFCYKCGEPVCEKCVVMPTYMNKIDHTLCEDCGIAEDNRRYEESERLIAAEEKKKAITEKRNKTRIVRKAVAIRKVYSELRKLIDSGYDGQMICDATNPLFAAMFDSICDVRL